jgi:hypothetical protein
VGELNESVDVVDGAEATNAPSSGGDVSLGCVRCALGTVRTILARADTDTDVASVDPDERERLALPMQWSLTPRKPRNSSFSSIFRSGIPTNTFWAPSERVGGLLEAASKLDEGALGSEEEEGGGAVVVLVPENATGSVSPTIFSSFLRISSANHVQRSTDLKRVPMAACAWLTAAWRSATALMVGFDFGEICRKALNTNCYVPR